MSRMERLGARVSVSRWTCAAAGVLAAVAFLVSALTAFGASTPISSFSKTGTDPTTSSTASSGGSPGTTKAGDTIDWVLNYANKTGATANVNITDPITGNQSFVPGSLQVPPGFSPKWSTDGGSSYVGTEPGSGVNAVGASGTSIPGSTGVEAQSQPGPAAFQSAPAGGDGFEALFVGNLIYNVHHHTAGNVLDCHDRTGTRCPGYPTSVSGHAGDPFGTNTLPLTTSQFPQADVVGSKIYYAAGVVGSTDVGVACADVATQTSCGFTKLGTGAGVQGTGGAWVMGGATVGSKYYLVNVDAKILCFDTALQSPCLGYPLTNVADPGSGNFLYPYYHLEAWDSRYVFGVVHRANAHGDLICIDTTTNASCPGFPIVDYGHVANGNSYGTAIVPVLDAGGAVTGICGPTAPSNNTHPYKCYDLNGQLLGGTGAPPFSTTQTTGTGVNWLNFGSIAVIGPRLYFAESTPGGVATYTCWDYSVRPSAPGMIGDVCPGFTSATSGAATRAYTLRQDKVNPDCIWEEGDADRFEVFSATFGGTNCVAPSATLDIKPSSFYCDGAGGHVQGWDKLTYSGLAPSDFTSFAVSITDDDGQAVPGWTSRVFPSTQTSVDLSGIPPTGPTSHLHVSVSFFKSGSPLTKTATVRVTFAGDAPQVCFKTRVGPTTCSSSIQVSDGANAVTNAGAGGSDAPAGNNSGTTSFNEANDQSLCVDLGVTKTATPQAPPGGPLTWTFKVVNNGPGGSTGYTAVDTAPPGVTHVATSDPGCSVAGVTVTCTHGPLAAGDSVTYTLTGNAPDPFPAAITNSVTVTGNETDLNPDNNTDTAKTIPSQPSVSIVKSATVSPAADQDGVKVGDVIAYTYTVKNTGNVALKTVSVDDPSVGTVTCPVPPDAGLPVGAAETCTADSTHVVTQADVDAGQVVDTATASCKDVTGGSCEPSPPSKVTVPGTPPLPTVSIQKIAHSSGGDTSPIKVGQTISYSYVVTNTGNVTISSVSVDDPAVGSVTCPAVGAGGLAPGGSVTCTGDVKHTVTQADVDSGQVTDTATATCKDVQGDACPKSPPSEVGVPSDPAPRVAIVKSAAVSPAADQDGVKVGDTIAYSYKVTNVGNVTLRSVSVSDPTNGSVSCPTPAAPGLAVGDSVTCAANAAHTVAQTEVDAGKVVDTATAGCTDTQGKACPPSDPSTVTLPSTPPQPSVSVAKSAAVTPSADQSAAKVGDTIAYSYKVTNTGNVTLRSVLVDDPTDGPVTCPTPSAPGLAPGDSETCTSDAPHTVTQADVDAGQIVDTATAACADTKGDPCPPSPPSKVTVPPVPANPSVSIVKTASVSPSADQGGVKVGDLIYYSYKVTNTGNVSLKSVSVDDAQDAPVDCPALLAPGLAPGDSVTCSAHSPHLVTQDDVDTGHVDDTATAGCADVQGHACPPSPPSPVTVPAIHPNPRLSIQKIAHASAGDQADIFLGETIQYSYLVTNTGNVTVNTVAVSDPTAGSVTCPSPTLAPGRSETCTADTVYTVSQGDVNTGTVTDTATVSCKDPQNANCPGSPQSSVTVPGNPHPAVAIEKTADVTPSADQSDVKVGDLIAYTYKVTNVGNTTLQTVSVDDPSIASVSCPDLGASGLAPGDSVTCNSDVSHAVTQTDVDRAGVTDTARAGCVDVRGTNCDPSDPSTVTVPAKPAPHVTIVKTGTVSPAPDQDGAKVGDKISYSYLVTNSGNTTLTSVSVDDPSAGAVTCPAPSGGLAPGDSETCTAAARHTVTQADVDAGKIVDTATAGCVDKLGDPCPPGDPSRVIVPPVPRAPSVSIYKTGAVTPSTDQTDVKVGDTVAYSYLVTNTGNVTIGRVSVSDPADGSVTCPKPQAPGLAPGASLTCTADRTHGVTQADIDDVGVTDFATARCADVNGNQCPESPPSKVLVPADPHRGVSVVKAAAVEPAADQGRARLGDRIGYTYMVTNTGNVDLKFVNVSDPSLGAVTCPIPAPPGLTPGASEVCTGDVQHIVTAADVRAGKVDDTATADGTDTTGKGSGPSGPSRTHTRVVRPSTKLTITKTVNRARAMPGQTLTYTITVTNHGPDDAPDVQVTDTPSIPLTHIHAHPSQGRCETRPRLTCLLGTIRQGHRATIRLTGTPSRSGTERNTATVGFSGHDTAPAVAGVTTHVGGSLELRKTPSEKTAKAGQTLTYTLRVTNPGSRAVSHVTVCDPLPSALVYVSSTPRAGLYDGRYCWSISSLAGHHARSVTITANVAPGRGGDVSNRATASGRGVSPVRATATVKVAPAGRTVCPGAPDTARREPPRAHAAC